MTTWATTSYTRDCDPSDGQDHLFGRQCTCAAPLVEHFRDLTADELPAAVFAVEASDNGGRSYASNGLRWSDVTDAKAWAYGLAIRWLGCTDIRVVRVTAPDPVGHDYSIVEVVTQTL